MKRNEIIRDFRRKAEIAGKPFIVEPVGHGKIRLVCNGQRVILPNRGGEIKDYRLFEHRLGLHMPRPRG